MRTITHLPAYTVAILALALIPAAGMPQGSASEQDLRNEWVKIQTSGEREARRTWWQDVNAEHLITFIEAGADVSIADTRDRGSSLWLILLHPVRPRSQVASLAW